MILVIYSIKFDLVDLQIPYSLSYISLKLLCALVPVALFIFYKNINLDKKIFACSFVWIFYCAYSTYFYAINYWIASIQVAIVYTSVLFIDRIQFLIMYSTLTLTTSLAILYSKSPYGFGSLTMKERSILFDDYISLQILTGVIYFIVTYPRIRKLKEDLKFSNFGKASSFILHEMQKPLSRLQSLGSMNDELESLRKTLSIAKQLQSGSLDKVKIAPIQIENLCRDNVNKYQEFLDYYKINVRYNLSSKSFKSDRIMLDHMVDNLVRNAIEANKENSLENRWIDFSIDQNQLSISNPYTNMISESDLFTPLKSSKEGNMGTGLHFCKTISDGLNHTMKVKCKNNIFEIRIEF